MFTLLIYHMLPDRNIWIKKIYNHNSLPQVGISRVKSIFFCLCEEAYFQILENYTILIENTACLYQIRQKYRRNTEQPPKINAFSDHLQKFYQLTFLFPR